MKLLSIFILILATTCLGQDKNWAIQSVDTGVKLEVKSRLAKLTCSIDKSFYEIGDTINIAIKITSSKDTSLMVADPTTQPTDCGISHKHRSILAHIFSDDTGSLEATDRKYKLKPGKSVIYHLSIPIDSTFKIEKPILYSIDISVNCWIYTSELGYLTEGDETLVGLNNSHDTIMLSVNEFFFWPGQLDILIVPSFEDLHLFPWQRLR